MLYIRKCGQLVGDLEGERQSLKVEVFSRFQGNVAHCIGIGVWILKSSTTPCAMISGFTVHHAHQIGIYVQAEVDHLIIQNVIVFDSPMGVLPMTFGMLLTILVANDDCLLDSMDLTIASIP